MVATLRMIKTLVQIANALTDTESVRYAVSSNVKFTAESSLLANTRGRLIIRKSVLVGADQLCVSS